MPRVPHVVIAGAGVGGLACAVDLASSGVRVSVFERSPTCGGKVHTLEVAGRAVDAGPTVLTMPWVFEALFTAAGARLDEHVTLEPIEILARHAWPDGARLDLFADHARSVAAVRETFGEKEARGFESFSRAAQRIFETVEGPFMSAQAPGMFDLVRHAGSMGIGALGRIDAFRSMARALKDHFAHPHLLQLFGRYATYCGSSPYEAPATLNVIAHVESMGVRRVRGGIRALAVALEALARARGVEIRCGSSVERIVVEGDRVRGVIVNGEHIAADAVVWNGDVSAIAELAGAKAGAPTKPRDRSLSAFTLAVVGRPRGFDLDHHNVFFSRDYPAEFRDLFEERRAPVDPTVYVCAQDAERFLLIVNAPATGDEPERWSQPEIERCERAAFSTLERCGLSLETEGVVTTTPVQFEARFPKTGGALYGPIARGAMSPLARRGARTKLRGLYLAGGSVHPGPGVPMAALSGRRAAEALTQDFDSTAPSRAAVISGTT